MIHPGFIRRCKSLLAVFLLIPALGSLALSNDSLRVNSVVQFPFSVGERLRYQMEFSMFRAGYSEMSLVEIDSTSCEKPAFHFRSRVKSTKTVDLFYKVRDVVEAWFDYEELFSYRYERRIREGAYRHRKFYDYNHQTGWVSISNENGPKGLVPFDPYSHNIVSSLYWVRCQPLEKGVDLELPVHDVDTQYPMVIKVYGLEEIEVPAGTFECWKIEPVVESEGLFNSTGRLWVWLSNDELRLPVKMQSEIPVGSVVGELADYRPGLLHADSFQPLKSKKSKKWDW